MNNNCALIVAGGKGRRVGRKISKQFIELCGKPLIWYTIKAFEDCSAIDDIVIVISKDDMKYFKEHVMDAYDFKKIRAVVQGGAERQDSVYNGLKAIKGCNIVLIHDGARPFVSERIIREGIKYAEMYGGAACGVMPKDTIKIKDCSGFSKDTLDRSSLIAVQTPQCFSYGLIFKAHEELRRKGKKVTDDTMAYEMIQKKVYLYDGSYANLKVTTPEDIDIAEMMIKNMNI